MIIKELFANLAILISLLFLYTQITKDVTQNLKGKILFGLLGGILGNILMQYSMHIGSTIIDLRHIPIITLAFYSGSIPAYIAMILIILGRFLIGINLSAYASIFLVVPITIMTLLVSKTTLSRKWKVVSILTLSNLISTVILTYLIQDWSTLMVILPVYWSVSYLGAFVAFYMIEFMVRNQQLLKKYKFESATDGLTGLNNVRKFDEIFNICIGNLKTTNEKLSLLYIDIDFFKKVNDTYGHLEGDGVLRELSMILKNSTRTFDVVSRNGGEEFTVLLLDCPLDRAREIAEGIRRNVEKHSFLLSSGKTIHITISIGVATYNETTKDATSLIEDADKALYDAKQSGRNRVCQA
ncbi:GGDEF domain-containing protein [Neobacillus sp. D3-1R]|uniref:GGDEF domain-containing protein n=1 Tax=Neobacillus sp. D3-1R TaxID=3445778 RepID=UPI003FA0B1F2